MRCRPPSHPAHYGRAPLRPGAAGRCAADRLVIPPITGGLHCGTLTRPGWIGRRSGHPAHYGRAPLRRRRRCLQLPLQVVIPPITGGLHCGSVRSWATSVVGLLSSRPLRAGSIAATTISASCGESSASSRPLRAGSIAAGTRCRPGRSAARSSRPLRAGSIAAALGAHGLEEPEGHPAHYGRAPLRPTWACASSTPTSSHPAHYGRAPLRHGRIAGRAGDLYGVIPPITGGLHCGPRSAGRGRGPGRSSRPLRAGSIAAPFACDAAKLHGPVIPPITGGLHCGLTSKTFSPVSLSVIPPITGRAPLRQMAYAELADRLGESSRPLRAGSIAAATLT